MAISYDPLWRLLKRRNIMKKELMEKANVSKSTMDNMWREHYVALRVLDRICTALECKIGDIIEHIPTERIEKNDHTS